MIKLPRAQANDFLHSVHAYMRKADKKAPEYRKIYSLYEEIRTLLQATPANYPSHPDLGFKCYALDSFVHYLDTNRVEICKPQTPDKPSNSVVATIQLALKEPRYLDKLDFNEIPLKTLEDFSPICSALSNITGVGHLVVQWQHLGPLFFKAIKNVPIRKLEIIRVLFDKNYLGEFVAGLSEYLKSNPPLQTLIADGWQYSESSNKDTDKRSPDSKVAQMMSAYTQDPNSAVEVQKFKAFLEEVTKEQETEKVSEDDNLAILLKALLKNDRLEVISLTFFQQLTFQSVTFNFSMRVTPESVRLIAQEYKLKELKLMCLYLSPKNQLCDRAFGYHLGSNPSFKSFKIRPDPDGATNYPQVLLASTVLIPPEQIIHVQDLEDIWNVTREDVRITSLQGSDKRSSREYLTE